MCMYNVHVECAYTVTLHCIINYDTFILLNLHVLFCIDSGIPQGKLIKRHCLPRNDLGDCWHWKDLNIGIDMPVYGKVFHITDCDAWTKVSLVT